MAETAPAQAAAPTTNAPATPANGATTGAPNAPTDQNANSRGLPYYEKLRRDLRDTISKKRLMDKSMVSDDARRARRSRWQSLCSLQSNSIVNGRCRCGTVLLSSERRERERELLMLTQRFPRPDSKTKYFVSSNHTLKKQQPETSSKDSTIISKDLQVVPVSGHQV